MFSSIRPIDRLVGRSAAISASDMTPGLACGNKCGLGSDEGRHRCDVVDGGRASVRSQERSAPVATCPRGASPSVRSASVQSWSVPGPWRWRGRRPASGTRRPPPGGLTNVQYVQVSRHIVVIGMNTLREYVIVRPCPHLQGVRASTRRGAASRSPSRSRWRGIRSGAGNDIEGSYHVRRLQWDDTASIRLGALAGYPAAMRRWLWCGAIRRWRWLPAPPTRRSRPPRRLHRRKPPPRPLHREATRAPRAACRSRRRASSLHWAKPPPTQRGSGRSDGTPLRRVNASPWPSPPSPVPRQRRWASPASQRSPSRGPCA